MEIPNGQHSPPEDPIFPPGFPVPLYGYQNPLFQDDEPPNPQHQLNPQPQIPPAHPTINPYPHQPNHNLNLYPPQPDYPQHPPHQYLQQPYFPPPSYQPPLNQTQQPVLPVNQSRNMGQANLPQPAQQPQAYNPALAYFRPIPDDCPYAQSRPVIQPYIGPPAITAHGFKLRPDLIKMVQSNQFSGLSHENPHTHLRRFLELSDTVKHGDVDLNEVRALLFHYSLKDQATEWYELLPLEQQRDWKTLVTCFLEEYFPESKIMEFQKQLSTFRMGQDEEWWDAWKRFKRIVRDCPQHGFEEWRLIKCFYQGLPPAGQNMVDCRAKRDILKMRGQEAWKILDDMCFKKVSWRESPVQSLIKDHQPSKDEEIEILKRDVARLLEYQRKMESINFVSNGEPKKAIMGNQNSGYGQPQNINQTHPNYPNTEQWYPNPSHQPNHPNLLTLPAQWGQPTIQKPPPPPLAPPSVPQQQAAILQYQNFQHKKAMQALIDHQVKNEVRMRELDATLDRISSEVREIGIRELKSDLVASKKYVQELASDLEKVAKVIAAQDENHQILLAQSQSVERAISQFAKEVSQRNSEMFPNKHEANLNSVQCNAIFVSEPEPRRTLLRNGKTLETPKEEGDEVRSEVEYQEGVETDIEDMDDEVEPIVVEEVVETRVKPPKQKDNELKSGEREDSEAVADRELEELEKEIRELREKLIQKELEELKARNLPTSSFPIKNQRKKMGVEYPKVVDKLKTVKAVSLENETIKQPTEDKVLNVRMVGEDILEHGEAEKQETEITKSGGTEYEKNMLLKEYGGRCNEKKAFKVESRIVETIFDPG